MARKDPAGPIKGWIFNGRHEIVKVQVAIGGQGAGSLLLVYNQDRSINVQLEDPVLLQEMGNDVKAFFEVILRPDRINGYGKYKMQILNRVIDRVW
jgi:hypothetical protein